MSKDPLNKKENKNTKNKQTNVLAKFSTSTYMGNPLEGFCLFVCFLGDEERTAKKAIQIGKLK